MKQAQPYYTGGQNDTADILYCPHTLHYSFSKNTRLMRDTDLINRTQLYNVWLWKKFVDVFRHPGLDNERWHGIPNGWRSEYWGKMMRGAALICSWTKDETLYEILTDTVRDLLTTQDEEGRITTYSKDYEFNGWDMWGRKYVLLGLEYYLEICRDGELAKSILETMCRHADYILAHVGAEREGKRPINQTTQIWGGLNSSSILEPMVRLYNLTGETRYLDFAHYIVAEGGSEGKSIFDLAYEDELAPYQYPFVKAYEMMSCFEGLVEYARVTGNERYRTAAIRFGYKLLDTDVTVIGCCGCTHELFDHSAKNQTRPADGEVMQETCVTVTWMKLCHQLLRLTGDVRFADALEQSFTNAYLGALCDAHALPHEMDNHIYDFETKERRAFPAHVQMTFDSYSPLRADTRGRKMAGLCMFPDDRTYYGCCVAIGAAGMGIIGRSAAMLGKTGLTLHYYTEGLVRYDGEDGAAVLRVETDYPYSMTVRITVETWTTTLPALRLRIPSWSAHTVAKRGEQTIDLRSCCDAGYLTVPAPRVGEVIELTLDDRVRQILPPVSDAPDADRLIAFARGPVLLAADARLCHVQEPVRAKLDTAGYAQFTCVEHPFQEIPDARVSILLEQENGVPLRLVDYSSAGKTYSEESLCSVWLNRV